MYDLTDLTLIMCTYNRPEYAKRAINFWAKQEINLIVLDGSTDSLANDFISSLPPRVLYMHSQLDWLNRMLLGANLSKTAFTSLISDDEYYLPESLSSCIETLRENSELVSVIGNAIGFKVMQGKVYFKRQYTEFNSSQVTAEVALERVTSHFNPYRMTSLFAVVRTPNFIKNVMVANVSSRLPGAATFELGFELANSFQGQSRVIPVLHWLRSAENPPVHNSERIKVSSWLDIQKHSALFLDVSSQINQILGINSAQSSSYENSILYSGLLSYAANEKLSERNKKKKLFFINSFVRNNLKVFLKILIGRTNLMRLLEFRYTKMHGSLLGGVWMSQKSISDVLQKESIRVPTYSFAIAIESIKTIY
jgi:glycosyltransferase domain-containing protein